MSKRRNPEVESLLDRVMTSSVHLPMPQTMHDRWIELILMNALGQGANKLTLFVNDKTLTEMIDYSAKAGVTPTILARTLVETGMAALKMAEYQDERFKAQYHMREALDRVQHLSPNDRRTIREYLAGER